MHKRPVEMPSKRFSRPFAADQTACSKDLVTICFSFSRAAISVSQSQSVITVSAMLRRHAQVTDVTFNNAEKASQSAHTSHWQLHGKILEYAIILVNITAGVAYFMSLTMCYARGWRRSPTVKFVPQAALIGP